MIFMHKEKMVEGFIRGFTKPIILWLLCIKPRHGYNIIKELKRITGRNLTPAVIYPFLHKLEKKGYVIGTWMKRGKKRLIKTYEITPKGKTLFTSLKKHFKKPLKKLILDLLSSKRQTH